MAEESRYLMEADAGGPVVLDPFEVTDTRIRGPLPLNVLGSVQVTAPPLSTVLGVTPTSLTSVSTGVTLGTGGPNIRVGGQEVIGRQDIFGENISLVRDPITGEPTPLGSKVIDLSTTPSTQTTDTRSTSQIISETIQTELSRERARLNRDLSKGELDALVEKVLAANTSPSRNIDLSPTTGGGGPGQFPLILPLPIDPALAAVLTGAGILLGSGGGGAPSGSTTGGAGTGAGTGAGGGAGTGAVDTTGGGAGAGTGGGAGGGAGSTGGGSTTTTTRGSPEGVAQIDRSTVGGAAGAVLAGPIFRDTSNQSGVFTPVAGTGTTNVGTGQGGSEGGTGSPGAVIIGTGTGAGTGIVNLGGGTTGGGVIGGGTTGGGTTGGGTTGGGSTGGRDTGTGGGVTPVVIGTGTPSGGSSGGNISFTINPAVATPITVKTPDLNRDLLREGRISTPALKEIAGSTVSSYGSLAGQPGQYDVDAFKNLIGAIAEYTPELTRIATEQTVAGNRAIREASLADVQRLGPAAMEAYRAANPELYSTLGTYLPAATGMLATDLDRLRQGGRLTAEEVRSAQQSAREAGLARGREMDQSAVAAEVLNRDALARAREAQARANVQQSMQNVYGGIGAAQAASFNPFANLLGAQYGMQTANVGTNQALFGQGAGFTSGQFSNPFVQALLNPFSPYAQDVYGSNFNAANARAITEAMTNAAAQGANLDLIGNVAGQIFKYAIPAFGSIFTPTTTPTTSKNPIG